MPVVPRWSLLASVFVSCAAASAATEPAWAAREFAPRSGPRGATLFTELPAAATGIVTENNYDDPRMWWERFHEFEVGAIGTGVTIGDYDGDGRPDVFVTSKTARDRLFRNLGDWKFEDVTERAGVGGPAGAWKQGAAFADVDNDGRPDLYVCRHDAPNLLYVNRGDGTFREEAAARGLAVRDASGMAAFCDFDRDGWLDVLVQTNLLDAEKQPTGRRDRLFRNNRDGTFADVTERAGLAGETQGHSATWWDFDEDGWPDLYLANDFAPADQLYRNNRDGTFTEVLDRVVPHTPFSAMGADLGDADGDGRLDLLVADMAGSTHEKDQRGMALARGRAKEDPRKSGVAPQLLRNALYLNTGAGVCREAAELAGLAATDWTWSVRFEDLDEDGRVDLHVTTGMVRELHNDDLLARMAAAERTADRIQVMRGSPVFAERNRAYRNLGDLRFAECGAAWGLDQLGVSFGAAFGDLDGDGDLDLVFANYERGATVLRNDNDRGHRVVFALRGTASNRFGVGATLRLETAAGVQVRQLVLARGYLSTSEPVAHFGLGDETRIARLVVTWPSGRVQTLADLPADRAYTLVEPAGETTPVAVPPPARAWFAADAAFGEIAAAPREAPIDETATQPLLPWRLNRAGPALAAGDLDGDGRVACVLGGTTRDPARVLRAAANGTFRIEPLGSPSSVNDGPVALFDADGDGRSDVLVTRGGVAAVADDPAYQPQLWLNRGAAGFAPAGAGVLPALPLSVGAVAAADGDGDGRVDVFLGARCVPGEYPRTPRSVLLVNRGDRFEDATAGAPGLGECGLVTAAAWADLDGDGRNDLVVACEWGPVRVWRNSGGGRFAEWTGPAGFAAAGTGWWTALAVADFNGDGRPDVAAGNVGLNTPYRATAEEPALLFVGDWGAGGATQLVEASFEDGRLRPRRNRKQLAAAIPAVRRKFSRTDDFARATLGEVLGEERLAAAQRFAATELRGGVFLSQRDGTWRFTPWPRIAQIAPATALAAADFDGDGTIDLAVAQNSHAPVPYVGRFDGGVGQVMRGDGAGGFVAVPPAESGVIVRGEAKGAVAADVDGDGRVDLVMSRSGEPAVLLRNVLGRRP